MASPQCENGYTKIANELMQVIYSSDFTSRELKIILCIFRFSYGYSRKIAKLSLRDLSKYTNINIRHVQSTVSNLISENILIVQKEFRGVRPRELQVNKDYDSWEFRVDRKSNTNRNLVLTRPANRVLDKSANSSIGQIGHPFKKKKENIKEREIYFIDMIPSKLLSLDGFKESWCEWVSYRKEIKKKITQSTAKHQLEFLIKQSNPIEVIETSILRGWQGLFQREYNSQIKKEVKTLNFKTYEN
ncbi:MAG: replication protein [Actinobacteria bacterium]|nr:replication protein [Actinomycetota bacterium]